MDRIGINLAASGRFAGVCDEYNPTDVLNVHHTHGTEKCGLFVIHDHVRSLIRRENHALQPCTVTESVVVYLKSHADVFFGSKQFIFIRSCCE